MICLFVFGCRLISCGRLRSCSAFLRSMEVVLILCGMELCFGFLFLLFLSSCM